jgi:3-hydroxybutyryl-CoA dehydrogenase
MRVAVLGAGLMGAQIGCEYALGGHDVVLYSRDPDAARRRADAGLALVREHGVAARETVDAARARVSLARSPEEAGDDSELLVESLPEELDLKARVVRAALASARADAVVATNTSSLSITALGDEVGAPERTIGTHYWNPPLLMPLVEVVAGARTASETVAAIRRVLTELGKRPVLVRRDVTGFVWNRLQFALVRECVWLVENGVTGAEELDEVVRSGLARRWRRVGPLRSISLGGVDTWNRAAANIVPSLSTAESLPDLGGVAIAGGSPAADAAKRDAELAAELVRERREQ